MSAPESAAVGLTTIDDTGAVHVRCWFVPPRHAGLFAAYMTSRFGAPDEMATDAETMEAGGQQAAAEGRAVFLLGGTDG